MQNHARFRITKIHQKKCNFCCQWTQSSLPIIAPFFFCDSCEQNIMQNGINIQSTKGNFYTLQLIKNPLNQSVQPQNPNINSHSQSLINQDVHQTYLRWSRVQQYFDQPDTMNEQIQTIQEQHQQINQPCQSSQSTVLQFIRNLHHTKSKASLNLNTDQIRNAKVYQSLVQNKKQNHINISNIKPLNTQKLQDYCKNLGATRFINKYQYYYDTQQIKRYNQDIKPLKTRQFGSQISLNSIDNSSIKTKSNKKLQIPKLHFNRSTSDKQTKLTEQELKLRIVSFLQGRSQSITMNRIMATYVRQAYLRTNIQISMIELVSFKITNMDLQCYLSLFDLDTVTTIKLINVGLTDQQLMTIIDSISTKNVERLVLTGNLLTQNILCVFLQKSLPWLREIYLGKNRINKYRMKQNICELKSKFILYL